MKISYRAQLLRFLLPQIAAASALLAASSVHAADGTWNVNASGTWSTTTNWLNDTIASGSGSTAYFTNDITADRTVTLSASETLTNIVFGDSDTATAGSWIISNTGTNFLTLQGATPTITVNALGTGKTATILANVRGTAGLTKAGDGMLVLTKGTGGQAASFPSGALTVNSGTLRVNNTGITTGNNDILTLGSMTTINNGSTLIFSRSSSEGRVKFEGGVTFGPSGGNTLVNQNGGSATGDAFLMQGSYTFTTLGGTTNYINATVGGYFNMQSVAGRYAIFDVADGTGATDLEVSMAVRDGGIRKNGAGVLTLTNNNTGINNFEITAGTLELAGAGRLNSGTFSLGFTNNGTLLYNGSNDQALSGVISGSGSLTKSGTATLTLSAANDYAGTTTINAGTLKLDVAGAIGGSSGVSVASGASLDLSAIAGGLTLSGQSLGGAGSILGDLVFGSGSQLVFSTTDTLVMSGGTASFFAGTPGSRFGIDDLLGISSSTPLGTYTLISGAVDTTNLDNLGSTNAYDLGSGVSAYFQQGSLQVVVVPEPGALSLAGIGAAVAAWCAIRRRHPYARRGEAPIRPGRGDGR